MNPCAIPKSSPNKIFFSEPHSDLMDSPTACSRYTPQNSKKRVFVSGGSSSVCKEVDMLEISPPATGRSSKPNSSKQKGVIFHEIIDVDMEEECDDASLTDCKIDKSGKGKQVLSSSSVEVSSLANENDMLTSTNGSAGSNVSINIDDFSSDLYYGEDDWIESYYDDITFDDQQILESHFDHMDIPPGVEASFPWLPSSPKNDIKLPTVSSSLQSDGVDMLPGSNSSLQHTLYPMPGIQMGDKYMEGNERSATSHSSTNLISLPSVGSLTHKIKKEYWHSCGKSFKKPRTPKYPSPHNQFPSGQVYPSNCMPLNPLGVGHTMPFWKDLPTNMWGPSGYMNQSSYSSWDQNLANNVDNPTSMGTSLPTKVGQINVDEVLQKYINFKKFETVEDYSDHHYSKTGSAGQRVLQPPKNWAKRIQEEWKILESDLPDTIFVRVYESRMDLLRAVIIGAEGTPYHDGLFFFDVIFPSAYPKVPPHVYYHSGGLRINPNLYHSGKVCLSLLNTWSGTGKEKWIPGVSTVLQVLVSIQGLILNAKPYFNEPGYELTSGTAEGERKCLEYNEKTFLHSLRTMVYSMRRPPKHFEDFVYGHFCKLAHDILVSCKAYLDGAQVGCLVRGGVQDVDEGDKSCSQQFKNNLAAFITTLVNTFIEIGAENCEEFLSLANKGDGPPTPLAHNLCN